MNTKIIKFDINKNLYDTLIAKQGDTKSRFLLFNLLDGSIPFSLENRSVRVYAIKPDGTEIFNDLIITDAAKGYCILELTTQMLAVAGIVKLELMVIEDEKKLTSNIFYMDVKKSINSEKAVVSTNEFGALLTALSSLNEYDNYKKEIAAARDGEANLLTKVKKIDEQLEHIVLGEYIIDSTTDNGMTLNAILNTDYLRYRNNFLYSDFFKKLRSGEYVKVLCLGDSITYGYDITSSDRRPADTNPCDDGTYHHFERASKTYPEALSEFLNGVYNNKVTVINKGFAGDNTEMCYNRWNKNSKSNLTLIDLGINDAIGDWNTWYNDLNKYILWYEKLICREIARGSAVVILIPHKLQLSNDISIDVFRKALIQLADKYNCPILDLNKAFANYSYDNYSDTTHLNGKGYTILASIIMSVFIGNGLLNIDKVVNNTVMLSRPSLENITTFGTTLFASQSGGYTAWEYANNQSILTGFESGGGVVYSFETLEDNMIVIPNVWTNGSYKLELDFNIEQPYLSLYNLTDTIQTKIPSSKTYNKSTYGINIEDGLRIARKGKHTLKITSLSGNNSLNGIVFKSYPSESEKKKVLIRNTHNEWSSSPTQVNSIAFSINEIETCLGITIPNEEAWKCPTLKITVTSIDGDILTYALFIGRKNGDNYLKLSNVLDTFNLSNSNKTRTISSVSLDVDQQILILNFGGVLDSLGNVRIDLF